MTSDWIKTRQTRYTGYVILYVLVIVAVLGAANFLAQRHNKSVDTTANKRFSLSDQTIKIVKGLGRDVKITYFDKTSSFQQAKDLLDRYDNLSAKLHVEYVDPDKKPQVAKAMGVRTYGTTFVDSGVRKEEAKSVTEEEITGALIRSLKSGERNACLVAGFGEHTLDDSGRTGYSNAKEALEKNNYKTRAVNLLSGDAAAPKTPEGKVPIGTDPAKAPAAGKGPDVPKDCTVLIVAGPRNDYPEPVVNAIKSYVENGGRAMFLIDPPLTMGREQAADNAGLVKLLADWGVTLNRDLAVDVSGIGQIFGLSEVVPLVTSYESHAIVREMKDVATAFPLARTLDAKAAGKSNAEKLLSTSANSFGITNLSSPQLSVDPKKDKKGPLPLAAAGTYDNKGRFVVVGTSSWIANNILRFNGNRDLFLNMMNWLSSDEDLISIRPKEPEDRRLSLSRSQMKVLFWSSIVLLPLLVIGSGLAVWWRRR